MSGKVLFPVSPAPLQTLESLLEEIRAENSYDTIRHLLLPGPPASLNLLRNEAQYLHLSGLSRLSPGELFNHTLHRFVPCHYSPDHLEKLRGGQDDIQRPLWEHKGISLYIQGVKLTKFCPHCWKERQILLLPWQLRYITICSRHSALLIDNCPNCRERLRIKLKDQICARCGQPVRNIREEEVVLDRGALRAYEVVAHALGIPDGLGRDVASPIEDPHPLGSVPPYALLRLVWRFGQLIGQRCPEYIALQAEELLTRFSHQRGPVQERWEFMLRQAPNRDVHQVLVAVGGLLHGWPQTYHALLERIAHAENHTPVYVKFPSMVNLLFPEPEYDFLREEFCAFMEQYSRFNTHLYPWLRYFLRAQRLSGGSPSLLTRRAAAGKLRMSEKNLEERIESSQLLITPRPRMRPYREWTLLDAQSVESLRMERRGLWTLRQVVQYTGLGPSSVASLVEAGLLLAEQRPDENATPVWVFKRETVLSKMREILRNVTVRVEPACGEQGSEDGDDGRQQKDGEYSEEGLTIEAAMRTFSWLGLNIPDVLLAVCRGSLPAYLSRRSRNFKYLRITRQDVADYSAGLRRERRDATISAQQVCKLLKCHPEVLQRLSDAGLLNPVLSVSVGGSSGVDDGKRKGKVRRRYDTSDVDAFMDRYITSDEAAKLLGCTRLTAQRWAREGRISAVLGPQSGGGTRTYLFDRYGLAAWRHDHLTVGEAAKVAGVSTSTIQRWAGENRLVPVSGMGGVQRWFARSDVERCCDERCA